MNDRWSPFTPAAPVRDHLERLRSAGLGIDRIAHLASVPGSTVREIIYGSGGRKFGQVRTTTADRLLATIPEGEIRSDRSTVDALTTRMQIDALCAQGMTISYIADRLGRSRGNLQRSLQRSRVTVKTAADVAELCRSIGSEQDGDHEAADASSTMRSGRATA